MAPRFGFRTRVSTARSSIAHRRSLVRGPPFQDRGDGSVGGLSRRGCLGSLPAPHVRSEGGAKLDRGGKGSATCSGTASRKPSDRSNPDEVATYVSEPVPAFSLGLMLWRGRIVWDVADKGGSHSRCRAGKEGPGAMQGRGPCIATSSPRDSTSSTVTLPVTPRTAAGRLVCTMHFACLPPVASPSRVTQGLNYKCTAQGRAGEEVRHCDLVVFAAPHCVPALPPVSPFPLSSSSLVRLHLWGGSGVVRHPQAQ